jgi:hypothetical protein
MKLNYVSNMLRWQSMNDSHAGRVYRGVIRFAMNFMYFFVRGSEFPRWPIQFTAQDPDVSRSVECQCHPITGDAANLQNDVITHVNPFTNFST